MSPNICHYYSSIFRHRASAILCVFDFLCMFYCIILHNSVFRKFFVIFCFFQTKRNVDTWSGDQTIEQRMCLGTFWRLRRSLATSSLYAAVRILPEAFCIIGNAISYYTKKDQSVTSGLFDLSDYILLSAFQIQYFHHIGFFQYQSNCIKNYHANDTFQCQSRYLCPSCIDAAVHDSSCYKISKDHNDNACH